MLVSEFLTKPVVKSYKKIEYIYIYIYLTPDIALAVVISRSWLLSKPFEAEVKSTCAATRKPQVLIVVQILKSKVNTNKLETTYISDGV